MEMGPQIQTPENKGLEKKKFSYMGASVVVFSAGIVGTPVYLDLENQKQLLLEESIEIGALSAERRAEYDAQRSAIVERVGESYVVELKGKGKEKKEENQPTLISGFDDHPEVLITNKDVHTMTNTLLPKSWVEGKIKSIAYSPKLEKIKGNVYEVAKNTQDEIAFARIDPPSRYITDTTKQKFSVIGATLESLGHEICHSNDWESQTPYAISYRIGLLSKVIERVESKDAYEGHIIDEKNTPYHMLHGYATPAERKSAYREYFADICGKYMSDPQTLKVKYPKDYEIMYKHITATDADFESKRPTTGPFHTETGEVLPNWKNLFGYKS
jgi:hypothetical protein